MVDVVVRRLEVKSFNGLLRLRAEHLLAAQANTATLVLQSSLMLVQLGLEGRNHGIVVSTCRHLEPLQPKESTVTPIAPLKSEGGKADGGPCRLHDNDEAEVGICEDLSRSGLIVGPFKLQTLTVSLEQWCHSLEITCYADTPCQTFSRHSYYLLFYF